MWSITRFRAGVKDLEVMVQNVITSTFETVTTVQEAVEILEVFEHLSSREVRTKLVYIFCVLLHILV